MEEVSEREPEAWDMQVKRMKCRKLSEVCCRSVRGSGELCSSTRACVHCNSLVDRYETKTLRVEAKLLTITGRHVGSSWVFIRARFYAARVSVLSLWSTPCCKVAGLSLHVSTLV